jgi:hypothetical protein
VSDDSENPTAIPVSGELTCQDGTAVGGATYTFTMATTATNLVFTPNPVTAVTDPQGKASTSVFAHFLPPGPFTDTQFTITAAVTNVPPGACPGSSLTYTTATVSTLIAVNP